MKRQNNDVTKVKIINIEEFEILKNSVHSS